jgi:sugar O-acyltransferase (sialic acid O-acetyltransferase NeuD family)
MMEGKKGKIVIIGVGEFGEIAYEYFNDFSSYEVIAFSVEKAFISKLELFGLPVVPFEEIENFYPPDKYKAFVAVTATQLNRVRERLYKQAKKKGYQLVTFIHPTVFLGRDVNIGENCFIFEYNNIQRKVNIGDNVVIWAKNHIGHRSIIKDNCYLASGVIISGYCEIGENCFLGVNSSLNDKIKIAKDTIIGNGAIVIKNIEEPGGVYVGNPARRLTKSSYEVFDVKEEEI